VQTTIVDTIPALVIASLVALAAFVLGLHLSGVLRLERSESERPPLERLQEIFRD
jgi:hypothetical protein